MSTTRRSEQQRNGQVIVVFALALTAIVLLVGLVIDGGNALAQRRASQNASDFAALAGARIIAQQISGDTSNGTDLNVQNSMAAAVILNGGTALAFGASNNGPRYVKDDGTLLGYVGAGSTPTGGGRRLGELDPILDPVLPRSRRDRQMVGKRLCRCKGRLRSRRTEWGTSSRSDCLKPS